MRCDVVEGEPGIFPEPITRFMRTIGGLFGGRRQRSEDDRAATADAGGTDDPADADRPGTDDRASTADAGASDDPADADRPGTDDKT
jgi:hypothetical protein